MDLPSRVEYGRLDTMQPTAKSNRSHKAPVPVGTPNKQATSRWFFYLQLFSRDRESEGMCAQHPALTPSTAMTWISPSSSPARPISAGTLAASDPGLAAGRPPVTGGSGCL